MVAVVGVDAQLLNDFEVVLAPVLDVDQGVGQGRAVIAGEVVFLAQDAGGGEDVGDGQLFQQALELAIGEAYAVEGLEFLAEVGFERGAVADVGALGVLEPAEFLDEGRFDVAFFDMERLRLRRPRVGEWGGHRRPERARTEPKCGQYRQPLPFAPSAAPGEL